MRARDAVWLAAQKLRRRKLRSLLSALVVAMGLAPLALIEALRTGLKEAVVRSVDAYVVPRGYVMAEPKAPTATLETLRGIPGAASAEAMASLDGAAYLDLDPKKQYPLRGVSREFFLKHATLEAPVPVLLGRLTALYQWNPETQKVERTGTDLTALVGKRLDIVVGDPVGFVWPYKYVGQQQKIRALSDDELLVRRREMLALLSVRFDLEKLGAPKRIQGTIVGIVPGMNAYVESDLAQSWIAEIQARYKTALRPGMHDDDENISDLFLVQVSPAADPLRLAHEIESRGFRASSFEIEVERVLNRMGVVVHIVSVIALVVVILGVLSVISTSARWAAESVRELGLYRALGATLGQVQAIIVAQAILLAIGGGALGILLGNSGAVAISQWALGRAENIEQAAQILGQEVTVREIDLMPTTFYHFSIAATALLLVGGTTVCVLAAAILAARAARKDPLVGISADG